MNFYFKRGSLMIFSKLNRRSAILTIFFGLTFVISVFATIIYDSSNLKLAATTYDALKFLALFKNISLISIAFIIGKSLDLKEIRLIKIVQFYGTLLCFSIPLISLLFSIDVSSINQLTFLKSLFPVAIRNYWFITVVLGFLIFTFIFHYASIKISSNVGSISFLAAFIALLCETLVLNHFTLLNLIFWTFFSLLFGSYSCLYQSKLFGSIPSIIKYVALCVEAILIIVALHTSSTSILHALLPIGGLICLILFSSKIFDGGPNETTISLTSVNMTLGLILIFSNPLTEQILTRYIGAQNPNYLPNILRHLVLFSLTTILFATLYSFIVSLGLALRFQSFKNKLFSLPVSVFLISTCYLILNYSQFYGEGLKTMIWRQNGKFYLELINLLLIALIYLIIQTIFNRFWYSNTIFVMLMLIWSYANFAKIAARDEPIIGSDFGLIKSLPDIVKMVNLKIVISLLISLITLIIFSTVMQHFFFKGRIYKIPARLVIFIGTCFILYGFAQTENQLNLIAWKNQKPTNENVFFTVLNNSGFQAHPEALEVAANKYGPATTFMGTLIIKTMDKPNGYSQSKIKNVALHYKNIANQINRTRKNKNLNSQTIVYVLSESYADPRMVPTVKLSQNPIPFEQKIESTNTSGLMYSSGYGGGTANIEFEALTGLSMNNFDPSLVTPYAFLVPKVNNLPVITDYFKINNAIHPYTGTTYNRTTVFKKFGFQHFYNFNGSKLSYTKKIGKSQYISDDSAYRQLLKQLNSTNRGQFIQLSTMQNHMPYTPGTYTKNNYKATGKLWNYSLKKVESYSQGLNYTDKALKMLINKVAKMKKHITIVWYGDHLPGLYDGSIVSGNNATKYDNKLHQTNYFIYSNFKHQSLKNTKVVSPNMFTPMVFEQTDTKVSPYIALLTEINKYIPAAERNKFMNSSGQYIPEKNLSKKAKQILKDYKLIQYDITAGKQYSIKIKGFIK